MLSVSWYLYGLTFYTLIPDDFLCLNSTNIYETCDKEAYCFLPPTDRKIDYTKNLHNWVEKLDLACTSPANVGALGSSFFLGWAVSLAWLPRLADIHGRSTIFKTAMVATLILLTMVYLTFNIYVMIGINFLLGTLTSARLSIGYVYMQEFVSTEY